MEQFNFNYGYFYFNAKLQDNFLLDEFEIGIDDHFGFTYYHTWHNGQVHFLSLGIIYLYWKGEPLLDTETLYR